MKRIFLSLEASALESLRQTVVNRRFIFASILIGVVIIFSAWTLANSALEATRSESPSSPPAIWQKGAEGALVSLAYWVVPLVFPFLPMAIAYDTLKRDRATGYLETAMSRPVPRWGIAVGKLLGIFAAIAVPVVALGLASAFVIESVLGEPISLTFTLALIGSTLFLVASYLGLILLMGARLTPQAVSGLAFIAWIAFNSISPTAFNIGTQFLSIVSLEESQTFQVALADLASLTGVYQGLLSASVPEALDFVIRSSLPYWSVAVAGSAWLVVILVLYVLFLSRYPLG